MYKKQKRKFKQVLHFLSSDCFWPTPLAPELKAMLCGDAANRSLRFLTALGLLLPCLTPLCQKGNQNFGE